MTKKSATLLGIMVAAIVVLVVMISTISFHSYSSDINTVVEIKNSEAVPKYTQAVLTLKKSGRYSVFADWWKTDEMPGYITGLIVTAEDGKRIFSVTGGLLNCESEAFDLDAGRYLFRFEFIPSEDAYIDYCRTNFPNDDIGEVDGSIFRDGTWTMKYSVSLREVKPHAGIIAMVCGLILGILLIFLVITLSKKESENTVKYDERQIAMQGRAYKYGFFTILVYYALLMTVYGAQIALPAETTLMIFIGILIGACVILTYSVMKDAYFRMDEYKRFYIVFFALMAIINTVIGILHIVQNECTEDGVLTFNGCASLLCGIVFIYMLAVLFVKGMIDRKEDI